MSDKKTEIERFTKETERQHYSELKSLPIRMEDRRVLYVDLQAIFNFEREIRGKEVRAKRIPLFHLRLLWSTLMFRLKSCTLWKDSLQEIEIQHGTLTANVFHLIKYTLYYNLLITLIVFVGIVIPHLWILVGAQIHKDKLCLYARNRTNGPNFSTTDFNGSDPDWGISLDEGKFAECCYKEYIHNSNVTITNKDFAWLIKISESLSGASSFLATPFFYGYYTTHSHGRYVKRTFGDKLPLLYLASVLTVLIVSFCILIKNIADGIREIVRNKDGDVCIFSELIFCGFHHRTQNEDEARFRRKLWLHNLRIAVKQAKSWGRSARITRRILIIRGIIFVSTSLMIVLTAVGIYHLSATAYEKVGSDKLQKSQNVSDVLTKVGIGFIPSFAVSITNIILPNVFIMLSRFERYSLEASTALILYRSLSVRVLSVVVAVVRVFLKSYGCSRVVPNTCTLCPHNEKDKRKDCWESLLAREFYKILLMELVVKILLTFVVDPFRRMLKKIFFRFKIMRAVGTLRFNVIRHSIDIINVQVMCWIGFYFAPTYPLAVCIYLVSIFYVKKFSVLNNCVGVPESHKVTRTTTIFLSGKLVSFMFVLIFLMAVLGQLQPSKGCGPFATYSVPWTSVQSLMEVKDQSSFMFNLLEHVGSISIYVPLTFISLTILYHFYARRNRIHETAESVKDLIYMENQDKQYLASKLMQLRSMNQKKIFYDPVAIYDSERRFLVTSNKRPDLEGQWRAMRDAVLPKGTKPGIKRGALSEQMRKHAATLMAKSSSSANIKRSNTSMFKRPFYNRHKPKKIKRKKKRRPKLESEGPALQRVRKKKKKFRGNLNQLVNKILGKPYDNPLQSDSTTNTTEAETESEGIKNAPQQGVQNETNEDTEESREKKYNNVTQVEEFNWAPIKKRKRNLVGPGEETRKGTEESAEAKERSKGGKGKRFKAKKKLVKTIMSDSGANQVGSAPTPDQTKNKPYIWDLDKSSATSKGSSRSTASSKKPQKAKSYGGIGAKTKPPQPPSENDNNGYLWDAKNQKLLKKRGKKRTKKK